MALRSAAARRAPAAAGRRLAPAAAAGRRLAVRVSAAAPAIRVWRPSAAEAAAAKSWPTWGCDASRFPWSYSSTETCLLLAGSVVVTPDGGGQPVRLSAGDMAVFPSGLSCVWDVTAAVTKHYSFS